MMKLSTMQTVVATVDDQWESPLADALLQHWAHDGGSAKYWRASANFIFFFQHLGRDHVLRFNHASERTLEAIQAELDYVNALANYGIPVAKPIRSLAGNEVERIATPQGLFHTVVFEGLPGKLAEFDELTPAQFMRWGQALGELHNAAEHYTRSGRPTWEDHLKLVAEILPAEETVARQALNKLEELLRQLPITSKNFGLIHFDFELDNLIWDGEQPGLIDFDDSAWYWFVADIAFALRDLFEDSAANVDLQHESVRPFVAGYRKVRPLDEDELRLIPLLLRMHNLFAFARLHRTLTPVNPTGEPPWMAGLREKLAIKMQFYRDELGHDLPHDASWNVDVGQLG